MYRCGLSPCGGQGPMKPGCARSVFPCVAPAGSAWPFGSPAPAGNVVVFAGMLYTTQCQKPLPVGASGSYVVTTKLLVPAGAPLHWSAGETFCPGHPMMLPTFFSAIVAPGLRSGLVSVKWLAP